MLDSGILDYKFPEFRRFLPYLHQFFAVCLVCPSAFMLARLPSPKFSQLARLVAGKVLPTMLANSEATEGPNSSQTSTPNCRHVSPYSRAIYHFRPRFRKSSAMSAKSDTSIKAHASNDCAPSSNSPDSYPTSYSSLSSSTTQPPTHPFHSLRSQHEACLRRLSGSPLLAGKVEEGDTQDGYGVKLFEDGCLYAGDFEGGQKSGHGVQRWPDGHIYIGLWKCGKRNGQGEYRFSHGDVDSSGVIEDDECDVYQATPQNTTSHTVYCNILYSFTQATLAIV